MNLLDIRERTGPYWAAYQAYRRENGVIEDPDYVPDWFVVKLARDRVLAARVGIELSARPNDEHAHEVWKALGVVADALSTGNPLEPWMQQLVAGLLGAQEIETAQEKRWAEEERRRREGWTPMRTALENRHEVERVALAVDHLRSRGITTSAQLADLHAAEDAASEQRRTAQWRALDAIAEEARAGS